MESLGTHLGRFRGDAPYAHRNALKSAAPLAIFASGVLLLRGDAERLILVPFFAFAVYLLLRAVIVLEAWLTLVDLFEHGIVTTTLLGRKTAILWTDVKYVHLYYPGLLRGLTIKTRVPFQTAYIPWPVCDWRSFSSRVASLAGVDHPLTEVLDREVTSS